MIPQNPAQKCPREVDLSVKSQQRGPPGLQIAWRWLQITLLVFSAVLGSEVWSKRANGHKNFQTPKINKNVPER
jgi:hypothetical protein